MSVALVTGAVLAGFASTAAAAPSGDADRTVIATGDIRLATTVTGGQADLEVIDNSDPAAPTRSLVDETVFWVDAQDTLPPWGTSTRASFKNAWLATGLVPEQGFLWRTGALVAAAQRDMAGANHDLALSLDAGLVPSESVFHPGNDQTYNPAYTRIRTGSTPVGAYAGAVVLPSNDNVVASAVWGQSPLWDSRRGDLAVGTVPLESGQGAVSTEYVKPADKRGGGKTDPGAVRTQFVFNQPGVYCVTLDSSVVLPDLTITTGDRTLTFAVGQDTDPATIPLCAQSNPGPLPLQRSPIKPNNPDARVQGHDVTATWAAPEWDGGSPVTGYTVLLNTRAGASITQEVAADAIEATFTDVPPGDWAAWVTAANAVGLSAQSGRSGYVTVRDATLDPTVKWQRAGHMDFGIRFTDDSESVIEHYVGNSHLDESAANSVVVLPDQHAKRTVPEPTPGNDVTFIGAPGSTYWYIPQTPPDPAVDPIGTETPWLGFSSEHVESAVDGRQIDRSFTFTLKGVQGPGGTPAPGDVVIFSDGAGDPASVNYGEITWSTRDGLPRGWDIGYKHSHHNWAFTAPGVYCLAVETAGRLKGGSTLQVASQLTVAVGDGVDLTAVQPCDRDASTPASSWTSPDIAVASDPGKTTFVHSGRVDLTPYLNARVCCTIR